MSTRTSFRYSNAFKQKVIGEIESGVEACNILWRKEKWLTLRCS